MVKNHFSRNNNNFHKNTIKTSDSCMKNINSIIASNNKSILNPEGKEYGCNQRNKESCLLLNKCLTPVVIIRKYIFAFLFSVHNKTRIATHCDNHDNLLHLVFNLKISLLSEVFLKTESTILGWSFLRK